MEPISEQGPPGSPKSNPGSPKSNDSTEKSDYVSVIAHAVGDGVGRTVSELADITTAFNEAQYYDFPSEPSEEPDYDLINVNRLADGNIAIPASLPVQRAQQHGSS